MFHRRLETASLAVHKWTQFLSIGAHLRAGHRSKPARRFDGSWNRDLSPWDAGSEAGSEAGSDAGSDAGSKVACVRDSC